MYPEPSTSYHNSQNGDTNTDGPYYQGQYAAMSKETSTLYPQYGVYSPLSPFVSSPTHALTQASSDREYIQNPSFQYEEHPQATPPGSDPAQQANPNPSLDTLNASNTNDSTPPALAKRGRGRPLGSKNKDKDIEKPPSRPRGRPKGVLDRKPRNGYSFKDPRKEAARMSRKAAAPQREISPLTPVPDTTSFFSIDDLDAAPYLSSGPTAHPPSSPTSSSQPSSSQMSSSQPSSSQTSTATTDDAAASSASEDDPLLTAMAQDSFNTARYTDFDLHWEDFKALQDYNMASDTDNPDVPDYAMDGHTAIDGNDIFGSF